MNAIIDEDLPRSFSLILTSLGFTALDIRDCGLRGKPDDKVFRFSQKHKAVLFSADLGFSNILRFPLGKHYGICILRFPNQMSVELINREVKRLLKKILSKDYPGNLIIVSPSRVRIHRYKITH